MTRSQVDHALEHAVGTAHVAPDVVHVGAQFAADFRNLSVVRLFPTQGFHQFVQQLGGPVAEVGHEVQRVSDFMGHAGGEVNHFLQLLLGDNLVLRFAELGQGFIQIPVAGLQVGVGGSQLGAEPLHQLEPDHLDGTQPQRFQRPTRFGDFVAAFRFDAVLEVPHAQAPDPDLDGDGAQAGPEHQRRLDPDGDHRHRRQDDERGVGRQDRDDGQRDQQAVDQQQQGEMLHGVAAEAESGAAQGVVALDPLLWRVLLNRHLLRPPICG